jgi:hypothetical protein
MDPIAPNSDRLNRRYMVNINGNTLAIFRDKCRELRWLRLIYDMVRDAGFEPATSCV